MRILLTANASYVPPRGGATRSNLLWLEYMAARGHECRIVAGAPGGRGPERDGVGVSRKYWGHALPREAHEAAPGRVVYLAHTPQFFPFGPASWNPDPG